MKRLFTTILVLSSMLSFGQGLNLNIGQVKHMDRPQTEVAAAPPCSAQQDTVGLAEFDNRTTGLQLFGNVGGGYIFGVNDLGIGTTPPGAVEVAQRFVVGSGQSFAVNEVIFYVGAKDIHSANPASVMLNAKVYQMNGTAQGGSDPQNPVQVQGPGTLLGQQSFSMSILDTVNTFTVVPFNNYVHVNSDFAVAVEYTAMYTGGDTMGIVCNAPGDANGNNLAFVKIPQIGWVEVNWAYANQVDVDVVIFAVSCPTFVNVDSEYFYQGMKLNDCMPNPVIDNAEIRYALEKYTEGVTLEVFDVTGRVVKEFNEGIKEAGEHKVVLETSNLASGSYYYSLQVDGERLTKKFIITK